jgi:hypothetical protein
MTGIDIAQYRTFEAEPRAHEKRDYAVGIPGHSGSLFSGLDKIAYSLAALMALAPLAMAAYGALVVGA